MSNYKIAEISHLGIGLSPLADAFSGTVYSDVINMANFEKLRFIIAGGVGATGTSTFTVEACDDVVPTNVSAIVFHYRQHTLNDVGGTLTAAAVAGFTNTAGADRLITIEVDAEALLASGYGYARLKAVESADSPVLGVVLFELLEPRSTGSAVTATALT
jgi:hypothetical protein